MSGIHPTGASYSGLQVLSRVIAEHQLPVSSISLTEDWATVYLTDPADFDAWAEALDFNALLSVDGPKSTQDGNGGEYDHWAVRNVPGFDGSFAFGVDLVCCKPVAVSA